MSKPSEKAMRGAAAAVQELIDLGLIDENQADVFEEAITFAFDEPTTELEARHRKTWALAIQHAEEAAAKEWPYPKAISAAIEALPCPLIEATKDK